MLKKKIISHEHTVLMAPRRYGKTSLIAQTLKENNFYGTNIDFFFVLNQEEVTKHIVERISDVMLSLMPKNKAATKRLLETIQAMNPRLSFSFLGHKLELSVHQNSEKSISDVLLALDQFAKQANKPCVLVFDECQQIGELKLCTRQKFHTDTSVLSIFPGRERC